MRAIITADIHLGKPGRLADCLWALRSIRHYASSHDIRKILVLGDFFHDRVNVNIEVGSAAIDFLKEARDEYGQEWFVFPGNHDMFLKNSWEANSLKFISSAATLIEEPGLVDIAGHRFWIIPFIHYENVYMKVLENVEKQYEDGDVLLTHIGSADSVLNLCFLCKHWSVVTFENSIFDRVYSGHFHVHQQVGEKLWYPGSPIPFNFDEGLTDHGFFVYDMDKQNHEFVNILDAGAAAGLEGPPPCSFITVSHDDIENVDIKNARIRVHLDGKHVTDDEFDKLRISLIDKGALSVTRLRLKEIEVEVGEEKLGTIDLQDEFSLLQLWFDHDQPDNINIAILKELNKKVVAGSLNRIEDEN